MKSKRLILCLLGLCGWFVAVQAQTVALKTDLVNWATASLNLEPEVKVGRKSTMALGLSWNPWTFSDNKKWRHLRVQRSTVTGFAARSADTSWGFMLLTRGLTPEGEPAFRPVAQVGRPARAG